MNPATEYPCKGIAVELYRGEPVAEDDLCLNSRPENGRGFANNHLYHLCG
jgi:hypothetical protein